jgi:murein DD-endopeptidase MepM/ murein hydrolase activator NlpD
LRIGAGVRAFACALGTALLAVDSLAALPRHSPVPGGIAVLELPPMTSSARFRGQAVMVVNEGGTRYAIVGLPLDTTPGTQAIDTAVGRIAFEVEDKTYPTQHVRIKDKGKVDLSEQNLARVEREHAEIAAVKKQFTPLADPDLDFIAPADGPKSGRFGVRRIFNGQPRAPHVGLDFSVPKGAPIRSAAAGSVLATADYFFNGKTVYVDHGQGLITMYCHLDRIEVEPGHPVLKGERLGAAGATGRASGPHLHWSVILNGAMVDPELFLPVAPAR